MKVTFKYQVVGASGQTNVEPIALGRRLSPLAPVEFTHAGVVQESHPVRAAAKTYFGRGGGSTTESFVAQKEHGSHWAAVTWTRVTLSPMRGAAGTLTYEDDTAGRISLANAVCVGASGYIEGNVSFVRFQFIGGIWQSA